MIDYDKLAEAHNLAEKLVKAEKQAISIGIQFYCYEKESGYFLQRFGIEEQPIYESLDSLIEALKELTRPEPKYKTFDKAWILVDDKASPAHVSPLNVYVHPRENGIYKWEDMELDNKGYVCESEIYPSRKSLIEAQIDYWIKMRGVL